MLTRVFAAALAFLSLGLVANASTFSTYTLSNVGLTFGVGGPADGTLNGSFTVNTATNTLTALDITASAGTAAGHSGGGFEYTLANSSLFGFETATGFDLQSGSNFLDLTFNSALNGSGADTFAAGANDDESGIAVGLRNVATGSTATLGAVAAPEPSSLALLGTGMLGAVGLLRRRYSQA